jgi:NAD+ synthase
VVVGLSGGLDSSVAAHLAVRALGPGSVHGLVMPYRSSHPDSERHAELLVGSLGIVAERIEITPMADAFVASSGRVDRTRMGNAMARIRMILLYDRSAEHEALVLGTSNKTELLLGYGTLHGDLASAINPLGDLYKTQVQALAAGLGVPGVIRRKPPSADLWPGQSDESDLGFAYEAVDRLLALLVDARVSRRTAVAAGFAPALVDEVTRRVVRTHFKRRLPVVAKLSTRSIGWDFRYPRDWKS